MGHTRHIPEGAAPLSVVIGAGGTGGHIYPGLALAEALRRAEPDARISFVGTERGLETRLIPEAGYRLHTVGMIPFDPALGARRYLLPAALARAGARCRGILRRQGAQVAVGMGGYPSAPVIVGARFAGLPSIIHESNAVPGRANLFAARLTPNVALAFDRAAGYFGEQDGGADGAGEPSGGGAPGGPFADGYAAAAAASGTAADGTLPGWAPAPPPPPTVPAARDGGPLPDASGTPGPAAPDDGRRTVRTVGMPLVGALGALDRAALRAEARRFFGVPEGRTLVLVNGGSLGSARINAAVLELAARWQHRADVAFLVKTGPEALDDARARLAATGGARVATAVRYLDRMDLAYAAADLTVCRAGSATVAELAQVRLPAVLVPYPHAPHDHQTHNARTLTDAGAGLLLPDGGTTADALGALLDPLVREPGRLAAMADRMPARSPHAQAADRLAAWVADLARTRR